MMTKSKLRILLLITGSASILSCSPPLDLSHSALVFNERDVDQIRGEFIRARGFTPQLISQQQAYIRAQSANAVGIVEADPCGGGPTILSSGVLSSKTRLVTSLHSTLREAVNIGVIFGNVDASFSPSQVGVFYDDYNRDDYGYTDGTNGASAEHAENPLLANRLFAMSLNEWSKFSEKSVRDRLRTWTFKPVIGSTPNTWSNQGFATVNSTTSAITSGRDIAVFETNGAIDPPSANHFTMLGTGSFPINIPGVFFDHVPFAPFDEFQIEGTQPLASVHATNWPDFDDPRRARLSSKNGYLKDVIQNATVPGLCGVDNALEDLIAHTIDIVAGSSGGAVLAEDLTNSQADGTAAYFSKRIYGVGVNTAADGLAWKNSAVVDEPEPEAGGLANYSTMTKTGDVQVFTSTGSAIFDPNDRRACSPSNTSDCIECATMNQEGECDSFVTIPSELDGTSETGVEPQDIEPDDNTSSTPANDREMSVECWFDSNGLRWKRGAKEPGVIVGFIGGAIHWDQPETSSDAAVGSLLAICAPMSSVPYTENWEFLHLKGARVNYGDDSVGGRLYWGLLETVLQSAYEMRVDDGETHFRPVSMKMCPPNHVVTGVTLSSIGNNGAYGPEHYVGLRSIQCGPLRNNSSPGAGSTYRLHAGTDHDGYTMDSYPFLLDQKIGFPRGQYDDLYSYSCTDPDFPAVVGFEAVHDSNGRLVHFYARCGGGP